MGLPLRDNQSYSYGDYRAWPEDVRCELIDGMAYMMSPAPARHHQEVAGEIFRQLATALLQGPSRTYIAPLDVRIPKQDEADDDIDTVVQPDVLVVCDEAKLDDRGLRGAPDLIVEVISPVTASHDHVRKRLVYERAGVREYWLVHPIDRLVIIYRRDETLRPPGFGKPDVAELQGETPIQCLEGVVIAWDELVQRLPKPEF